MGMEPSYWSTVTASGVTGRIQTTSRTMSPKCQVKDYSFSFTNEFSLATVPNTPIFAFAKSAD